MRSATHERRANRGATAPQRLSAPISRSWRTVDAFIAWCHPVGDVMGVRGTLPSSLSFRDRVLLGAERHGLIVTWTTLGDDAACIVVRRPGTPEQGVTIWSIDSVSCRSDSGSVMTASDVVHRLRQILERRGRPCGS